MARKSIRQILDDSTVQSSDADTAVEFDLDVAGAQADRLLVERCLAGEVSAWEELYNRRHAPLCASIKSLVNLGYCDPNLVDEIAARVWYALVRNDGDLLSRFDPRRDSRLGAFFRGLARIEIMQYFRAERRRRAREAQAGRKPLHDGPLSDRQIDTMLDEFTATLTPGEQRFLDEYLLSFVQEDEDTDRTELSDANIWQRRHRIRSKLRAFFHEG